MAPPANPKNKYTTDVESRIAALWEACGKNNALFNSYVNKIISGQSSVDGIIDSWLTAANIIKAVHELEYLLTPDYIAQCGCDFDKEGHHPAQIRFDILTKIITQASTAANNFQAVDFAPHFVWANNVRKITALTVSDAARSDEKLQKAMLKFDEAMGIVKIVSNVDSTPKVQGNNPSINQLDSYTQAINAILEGDPAGRELVDDGTKEKYDALYRAVNDPDVIARDLAKPLFQEALEPDLQPQPNQSPQTSNRYKAHTTLGQARALRRDNVAFKAALHRSNIQNRESLTPLTPLNKPTADKGVWSANVCAQCTEGSNLLFRPMPVGIWDHLETDSEGRSNVAPQDPKLMRAAIVNGSLSLQIYNEGQQQWGPIKNNVLVNMAISNPYCTDETGNPRIEEWSWDENNQVLKRRYKGTDDQFKIESLNANKQTKVWEAKGDTTGFVTGKIDSQLLVNCNGLTERILARNLDLLDVKAADFPSVQVLTFSKEHYPEALQATANLLNLDVATAYRKQLEDVMNRIYLQADNLPQALAIFREVAMQRRPDAKLIPADHPIRDAYQELCELLTPNMIEKGLARPLTDRTEKIVHGPHWERHSEVPESPAQGNNPASTKIPAGPTYDLLKYHYLPAKQDAAQNTMRETLVTIAQQVHTHVLETIAGEVDADKMQRYRAEYVKQFPQVLRQKNLTKDLVNPMFQALICATYHKHPQSGSSLSPRFGFALLPEEVRDAVDQKAFNKAYVERMAAYFSQQPIPPLGEDNTRYKGKAKEFEQAARKQALECLKTQVEPKNFEHTTFGEVAEVVRLRLSREVHRQTPESRIETAKDHIRAKFAKPAGTFRALKGLKQVVYDRSRIRPESAQLRMAQPITLHRRAILDAGDGNDYEKNKAMVIAAFQDPDRITHCGELAYLKALHRALRAVYEAENLKAYFDELAKEDANEDAAPGQEAEREAPAGEGVAPEVEGAAQEAAEEEADGRPADGMGEQPEQPAPVQAPPPGDAEAAAEDDQPPAESGGEQAAREQREREKAEQAAHERAEPEEKTLSGIELELPKHPDDYTDDEKRRYSQIQQRQAEEARQANVDVSRRDIEYAAQREITEKRRLTKEELADLCEHTRALIVASAVSMKVSEEHHLTFIGSDPRNAPRGWASSFKFHSLFEPQHIIDYYIHRFRDHHAKTTHPSELQRTGPWRVIRNEQKGSHGLFQDASGKYLKVVYYNPLGVTQQRQVFGINIPGTTGTTDRHLQVTRIRATGFDTTVTHPNGAEDNMGFIKGKILNVTITAGKDDLQVILAHVEAAWKLGGFKSVDVVYNPEVPRSLQEYYQKNNIPAEYMQQEQAYRQQQYQKLQEGLTKLAEKMSKDSDFSQTDATAAKSPKFSFSLNGQAITIPNPMQKQAQTVTADDGPAPPIAGG